MAAAPADKPACKDAAEQLALCIEQTPCVKEKGGSIMECLKAKDVGECEVRGGGYGGGNGGGACGGRSAAVPAAQRPRAAGGRRQWGVREPAPACASGQCGHLPPCLSCALRAPQKYRTGYYHCRRQQLDMRTRIRGRKFADHHATTEDEKS
jgi:hypothetical protein